AGSRPLDGRLPPAVHGRIAMRRTAMPTKRQSAKWPPTKIPDTSLLAAARPLMSWGDAEWSESLGADLTDARDADAACHHDVVRAFIARSIISAVISAIGPICQRACAQEASAQHPRNQPSSVGEPSWISAERCRENGRLLESLHWSAQASLAQDL